jgi:aminopeptidase YwaD
LRFNPIKMFQKPPFRPWLTLLAIFLIISQIGLGQVKSLRQLVDTIASPYMGGRGYVDSGLQRAATFIENEYRSCGLQPLGKSYRQPFKHDVNVFDGASMLFLNRQPLMAGHDFIVTPGSRPVKGGRNLQQMDSVRWIDTEGRVVVEKVNKLTWAVSGIQDDYTVFQVLKERFPANPENYMANLDARRVKNFVSENVVGIVRGTEIPDSFLVLTAHYDHLGKLGTTSNNAVFRGANDNASGVALMVHLARQIAARPLRYSVVFIAFAGEEAGLLGSAHFVKNPLVKLKNIRFLVNLDLLGTGEEGIMVVNATEFPEEWKLLETINAKNGWLKQVGQRGKAQNSDHYWFTEAGVPAFFMYTMGGIAAYHDIFDLPETLPLTKTEEVGKLIVEFFKAISE